jgi:competence protein ComEC
VLRVSIGETAVLWPGDAEGSVERELLQLDGHALRSEVLIAAHHGSASSTTQAFLDAVSPAAGAVLNGLEEPLRLSVAACA